MNNDENIIRRIYEEKEKVWIKIDRPVSPKDIKTYLKIANITIGITKKINWFQRLMYKIFFGIEIERLEEK